MSTISNANWITFALVLSLLSLGLGGYLFWSIKKINKLKDIFFAGKNGLDLEGILEILTNDVKDLQDKHTLTEKGLSELKNHFNFAVQKVGIVRFNPFNDSGGDFSFCLALLDAANNGVVLTSMHGRQQHRIYTKKITEGQSEATLTQEEQQAIDNANLKLEKTISNKKSAKQSLRH